MKRLWFFLREVRWFIVLACVLALATLAVAIIWPAWVAGTLAFGFLALFTLLLDRSDN